MKPVNLLPESSRPKRASGGRGGSAYMVIGALALLLLAVVVYVLTANGINSKKEEAAKLSRQADAAEARAKTLNTFASFQQVKQTREQSVRQLAVGRFDWERMLRELARLLPPGTYVTSLDASAAAGNASGGGSTGGSTSSASSSSSSATSATGGGAALGPTLTISGCTRSHPEVATVLVRLRRLNRTTDVTLSKSSKSEASAAGGGAAATGGSAPAGGSGAQGAGGGGCGKGVSFDATVQFSPTPVPGPEGPGGNVPASLGGGS